MSKIVISGFYGFHNIGDEAILRSLIQNIRQKDSEVELVVLSNLPEETAEKFNVKAIKRDSVFSVVHHIRCADAVISGGGSLLQDRTSSRSIHYYLGVMQIALFFKKPVYLLSNGVGPIERIKNRKKTARILNKVRQITVRDDDSYALLKEIGVSSHHIQISADMVLAMEEVTNQTGEAILHKMIPDGLWDKKRVAIAVRQKDFRDPVRQEKLVSMANRLSEKYVVVFLPFYYKNDTKLSKEIGHLVKHGVFFVDEKHNALSFMSMVKCMDAMIGSRLHSLIFALVCELPMVAISYDPKIESFMEMLHLPVTTSIETFEPESVLTAVERLWVDEQRHRTLVVQGKQMMLERLTVNDDVLDIILAKKKGVILDVGFDCVTIAQATERCRLALEQGPSTFKIYTPNPEIVMHAKADRQYMEVLNRGDLVIADGIGIIIASNMKKAGIRQRVTGIDLMSEVIQQVAKEEKRIYLLGGEPGIAEKAAENIMKKYPDSIIVGTQDGYFKDEDLPKVVADIIKTNAEVLFVALGAPKQEFFIDQWADHIGVSIAMGVGGALDVWAGAVKRAPKWVSKIGLEWLYRMIKQPSRIKRMIKLPAFLFHVLVSKKDR